MKSAATAHILQPQTVALPVERRESGSWIGKELPAHPGKADHYSFSQ
ncbi:hypothetical protein SAMN05443574_103268 [Haloarcula vallismortis]|uniref:Uncharacterized protein n=1 Tax=Haloarcula vallismortis TaxID=28442 RepID=A0A1H2TN71_HALVA|nr:hypothetical protein SAMN05443574_103268 [Haloarcula vallismortis]